MNARSNRGATLGLVAASIIFIVLVAIAFYAITQLLGGGRELQHSTNSGALNVAKQAAVNPKVNIPVGTEQDTADMKEILVGVLPDSQDQADLLHFNRMVGAALLVAANAEADGNSAAVTNAQNFIDLVEHEHADGQSIGQALSAALADGPAWAKSFFDDTAQGNSLRMLGGGSYTDWQGGDFKVAYLNAGSASNVNLNFLRKGEVNNLPFTNIDALRENVTPDLLIASELPTGTAKTDTATNDVLMLGYTPISFTRVARDIFAVPFDNSPHLVSLNEFNRADTTTNRPGKSKNVALPPNAFMNGAIGKDNNRTGKNVHMLAAAMVGSSQRTFDISMPHGYIVIDNHNTVPFHGVVPNSNNVFARELGEGIDVDPTSKYFDNDGQIRDWHATERSGKNGQPFNAAEDGPPWDKIFDNFGEPVQSAQQVADHVPYHDGPSPAISCTHSSSDKTSPGAISQCVNLTEPGSNELNMSPFDWAYHKNDGQTYDDSGTIDTSNLTSAEQTACKLIDTWQKSTKNKLAAPWKVNFTSPGPTGIRLYPEGHNPIKGNSAPWAQPGEGFNQHIPDGAASYSSREQCKVTTAGTLAQLIDQTMGETPDRSSESPASTTPQANAVEVIIRQRMHEILPATEADISAEYEATVRKQRLELGSTYYLYLDKATGNKHFKISTAPPDWVKKGQLATHVTAKNDGTKSSIASVDYGVAMTMADAKHQWGIHDTPFLRVQGSRVVTNPGTENSANGSVKAFDTVSVTPNSGAFGNLLNITFEETTTGDGIEFTDRN